MKRRKKIMAVVLSIAVIFGTIIWQGKGDSRVLANTSSDAWELVWSDEFNDMSLNMDYWSYETSSMVGEVWKPSIIQREIMLSLMETISLLFQEEQLKMENQVGHLLELPQRRRKHFNMEK